MNKKYLFIPEAKRWNSLIRKFINLHKRIKKGNSSEQQTLRMSGKLQSIYKCLERMQYRVGIKLAGSALALMLISATSFSQDFTSMGKLTFTGDILLTINVSSPVYADIDGDSDLDLYVGEYHGKIKVFTNDGNGKYTAAGNLQADGTDIDVGYLPAKPTFADIDGDSDLDLYIGVNYGTIKVFINDGTGTFNAAADLQADGNDIDVGDFSAPVFVDIDGDSDLDLYVGERYGAIKVFKNDGTGTFNAAADLQADGADIDVGSFSAPVFADIDGDNDLDLYVGEGQGMIKVFINDGTGTFNAAADLQADGSIIDVGSHAAPVFADIDGDNDLDLYVGVNYGAIKVFINDGTGTFNAAANLQADGLVIDVGSHAAPVFADIDGDSDLDLYVGVNYGTIKVFINDGTGTFNAAGNLQADGTDIDVYNGCWFDYSTTTPVFADIDGDSDLDLFVGEFYGAIKVFINDGTGTFNAATDLQADGSAIDVHYDAAPVFADIDDDSDFDLYVGDDQGMIKVFTNDGTGTFTSAGYLQADGSAIDGSYAVKPTFADIDGDSDLDLYVGEYYGAIKVFINDGTGTFNAAADLQADGADIDVGMYAAPAFANLNGCTANLFVGNQDGYIAEYGSDIEDPTITCTGNQEVDAAGTHTYIVQGTEFDPTEVDDNCGVASVINDFNGLETLDGAAMPEGTTAIVWTVTDDTGNNETCSFDVLVNEYVCIDECEISIYPNPSNGMFTIETADTYNVVVIDITGKIVNEFIINNTNETIDLRNLKNGIYFVKFSNKKTVKTVKIIID